MRCRDWLRRSLAAALATLSLGVSLAVPVMDAADRDHGPVFESAHDRDACAHTHDHSICAQVAANAGIATDPGRHGFGGPAASTAQASQSDRPAPHTHDFVPLGSRAPPRA